MHVSVCDYLMCMCVCLSVHILVVSWIGLVLCLWSDGVGMAIQPMNLITRHHHPCQHCDQLRPQEAGGVGQEDIQLVETAPQETPLLSMQSRPERVQHKRDRLGGAALAVGIRLPHCHNTHSARAQVTTHHTKGMILPSGAGPRPPNILS